MRMRLAGWLSCVLLACASSAQADPVAVVAAFKGKVSLVLVRARSRTPVRATFGASLESGDRVLAGPGASATLFFNDGNVIELGAGSSMTIGGRVAAGSAAGAERLPREAFTAVSGFRLAGSRGGGLVPAPALRGGAGADTPEPLAPRNTDLLEGTARFEWRAVNGARRYSITLSGPKGEIWTRESDTHTLAWPAGAPPLAEGDYVWDVQAFDARGPLERATATFRVAPAVQAGAVRAVVDRIHESAGGEQAAAARYLAGAYLCQHGFLADAALEFAALAQLEPASPAPHEAMGDIYRSLGLTDLADAAYQKARALTSDH